METDATEDYRKTLRLRLKFLQEKRPGLTWKKIAAGVPMQYTYLSKALNHDSTHLSEEHLYAICRQLDFFPDEIEFILLQRSYLTSKDVDHKTFLFKKLASLRETEVLHVNTRTPTSSTVFADELTYLLDPLHLVLHMALALAPYRKDPRKLLSIIGLSLNQLKQMLRVLANLGFIELEENGLTVAKLGQATLHFSKNHSLMRYHQSLLKAQINSRLAQTAEEEKKSFLVTFTMDQQGFAEVQTHFDEFIRKVEKVTLKAKHKSVYQLSFDLFKWI